MRKRIFLKTLLTFSGMKLAKNKKFTRKPRAIWTLELVSILRYEKKKKKPCKNFILQNIRRHNASYRKS